MSESICQDSCVGCFHQGYLCRQFKYLQDDNEQLKADLTAKDDELQNVKKELKNSKERYAELNRYVELKYKDY